MHTQVKLRPFFFAALFILVCLCFIFSLYFSKSHSFLLFNQYHNNWLDNFFINFTLLGDGLTSVIAVAVLLLIRKYKEGLVLLAAFLSSGLLTGLLKNIFSMPRPKLFFEQSHLVCNSFIEGVTLSNNSSFPSGHTTSAFAMAMIIILLSNRKVASFIALTTALLVGYSRMYLGQHFLQDVTAGAFLGIVCAMLSYYFIYQKKVGIKTFRKNKYSINQEISPQWN